MKNISYFLFFKLIFIMEINPQADVIQSIDFDSEGRTVYALTGGYDYSYILRYDNGNLEKWNLTELFNLPFLWISTTIDKDGNIWAYQQIKLFKFDGINWSVFDIPYNDSYVKYSHIEQDDHNGIWISMIENCNIYRLNLTDTTWKTYSIYHPNSTYCWAGEIAFEGDSTWICTSAGLTLIYNDSVSIVLDTTNSGIPTQKLYSFHIDSKGNRWLGSHDMGLIKWVNDSTFISYNTGNSNLPNNFINEIDEDSKGNLWLATDNGFACFNGDSITSYSHLYNFSMPTIAVDQYDKVWLGTVGFYGGTLFIFDGNSLISITDIAEEQALPQQFELYQNYPNPFNPKTKITFAIPLLGGDERGGLVTLKVYDILGNEIAILVNEEKPAGNYDVDFTAKNLPSGVYFYQLKAGNFIETKKMILLR